MTFDPTEYIKGIQQLLISDKKRIAFLCGAGTSVARKNRQTITAPTVKGLTDHVVAELRKEPQYSAAIDEIIVEITKDQLTGLVKGIWNSLVVNGDENTTQQSVVSSWN